MKKTIEIVAHCWAKELPHYANALNYMFSSLVLDPPTTCDVVVTVCLDSTDDKTNRIYRWFAYHQRGINDYYVRAGSIHFPISELGRRAIGRNSAAKSSYADIVWFADVDQCYRDGILDRLANLEWPEGATMIYPKEIMIHRDHALGDEDLAKVGGDPRLIDVDPSRFVTKRYNRAIGGVQIVRGDFAREHGYLDGDPKWQRPTDGRFARCSCDRAYRSFCKSRGRIVGVDLPGVYRLRHTEAGHGRPPTRDLKREGDRQCYAGSSA